MSSQNFFRYDEHECRFVRVEYRTVDRVVHYFCMWVLCGVVLGGLSIVALATMAGSPADVALKAENAELIRQLRATDHKVDAVEAQIGLLSRWDRELYRSMLGLEPISEGERQAGVGGADLFSGFDVFSEPAAEVLKSVNSSLEGIEHKLAVQRRSFEEILEAYTKNEARMDALPVIKPVQGGLISGYGMRSHPIYKMRRMHEGVDFKADRGEPVYATGDATVRAADRQSGYGNLVRLDHGDGIESAYAHLSKFAEGIRPGKKVKRGDLIGYAGNTGLSEGPHLHYEIRVDGRPINPLDYLAIDVNPEEYREFVRIAASNPNSMD